MIEISFQKVEEATKMHQLLLSHCCPRGLKIAHLQNGHEYILKIDWDKNGHQKDYTKALQQIFFQFILSNKCDSWAKEIVSNQYFFKEEAEQRHIIDIMHSILEGEKEDLANLIHDVNLEECLKGAVTDIFAEKKSFSFDSFVQFRLRSFKEIIRKYVEISIDEYKMEQEYQVFVQTLREFLINRKPKKQIIHVFVDLDIQIFDDKYREITGQELVMLGDKKIVENQSIYIDPFTIGPLLALAPNKIYLYTEDREQAFVRTITNIFEERVSVREKQDFFQGVSIPARPFE
ncbi:putative sporulation protein YtxC [Niallia nealsonii]|uniref:putative sporulation protein YtxC n=1 Tax=Niallia nealsonii TaxID=115979 RepID=UPI0012FEFCF9|nr:putative sporulation protein YtxC [Niallia nealsonii]